MRFLLPLTSAALLVLLSSACGSATQGDNWPPIGIRDNSVELGKTAIGDCCYRGGVTGIQLGDFANTGEPVMAVMGQTGVVLFDPDNFRQLRTFDFEDEDGETIWFGLSSHLLADETDFRIAMLGGGYGDVGLLDSRGETLWLFRPDADLPPAGMVVDDTPGREARFYVSGHSGLYRLDSRGEVVWQIDEPADYLVLVNDADAALATASHGSRTLKLWTADGRAAGELALPVNPDGIAYVEHLENAGFVIKSGRDIAFVERSGTHRFTYRYDEAPVRHGPTAALLAMHPGQVPQLAVRLRSASATGKSVLTLLSLDGARLYEEYLDYGPTIAVLPGRQPVGDRLLVGEDNDKVWVYEGQPGAGDSLADAAEP
ncbi:MAG: hypothetical protein ACNA7J_13245 [Wenzhouxiangella sp.]